MIIAETNYADFKRELDSFATALEKFAEFISPEHFAQQQWPKIREKLVRYLSDNFEDMHDVPISDGWKKVKNEMISAPTSDYDKILKRYGYPLSYLPIRKKGGGIERVKYNENWMSTGIMKETLLSDLHQNEGKVSGTEQSFYAEIELDTSVFEDEYPIKVDEELESRGGIGIMRLYEHQQRELIESLVHEFGNLSSELFGGK